MVTLWGRQSAFRNFEMRRKRVFLDVESIETGCEYSLDPDESHHLCRVLRYESGRHVEIINGRGGIYEAQLSAADPKAAKVNVLNELEPQNIAPCRIFLYAALSKGAAWRLILEKSVEMGVFEIIPVLLERSVPRLASGKDEEKKTHKWQQIIRGAVKQSRRAASPLCRYPVTLGEALDETAARGGSVALLHNGEDKSLKLSDYMAEALKGDDLLKDISLFVGPEGGFTDQEIAKAKTKGARICELGPEILRVETAVIASLAVIHTVFRTF